MATIVCDEKDVKEVGVGDILSIPNLNSCIGVIFVSLNPKTVVGGHAVFGGFNDDTYDFEQNLDELLGAMKRVLETANGTPNIVIFIGSLGNDQQHWPVETARGKLREFFQNSQIISHNRDDTMDASYTPSTYKLSIRNHNTQAVLVDEFVYTAPLKSHAGGCCIIC